MTDEKSCDCRPETFGVNRRERRLLEQVRATIPPDVVVHKDGCPEHLPLNRSGIVAISEARAFALELLKARKKGASHG